MKKYIDVNGNIFESSLVANKKALENSMLNDGRRTGGAMGKRNLYLEKSLTSQLKDYFPEILEDFEAQKNENERLVKVFFSVLGFVHNNEIVNRKKEAFSESIVPSNELMVKLKTLSGNKSHFYIQATVGNAGDHGVSLKKWGENKELLYDVYFADTLFDIYVFKNNSECQFYCEFFQKDSVSNLKLLTNPVKANSNSNIIYYGAPGTGKSYNVEEKLKNIDSHFYERITFHPEFDNSSFVGGYKPISEIIDNIDVIKYKFVPQAFTNIYVRAWKDLNNQFYLVIEEINRGNCAEIFGDIFQLLDRNSNYTVSPSQELKIHLVKKLGDENHEGIQKGLKLPPNLSILATMNTSDQSLFPMDSAFKRRWDWEYVPICYEEKTDKNEDNESFFYKVYLDEEKIKYFKWIDFIKIINTKIEDNENLGMDKCIGNYFLKSKTKDVSLQDFINKVVFYLWNDVFKDEEKSKSIFEKGETFEKFFPVKDNGKELVKKLLNRNNIEIFPK